MKRWNLIWVICCCLVACDSDTKKSGSTGDGGTAADGGSGGRSSGAGRSGSGGRGSASGDNGGASEEGGASGVPEESGTGAEGSAGEEGAAATSGSGKEGGTGGTAGAGMDASAADDAGVVAGPARTCQAPVTNPAPTITQCPTADPSGFKATLVASGFAVPVFAATAPGDTSGRLFVVDRNGSISIVKDGVTLPTPFLELSVSGAGSAGDTEQGLLGLVFDPQYQTNGRFFVNYTGSAMGAKSFVVSYKVSANNPDLADTSTRRELLRYDDLEANHNGGMLAFGPDGCLYIGAGDGGGGDDKHGDAAGPGNGQDFTQPLGKILRIDVDYPTESAPGNLTLPGANPHIWDYGLRNPWRFSFDRGTGEMYIGDVGQDAWEEIDIEPKGAGNKNYGWRPMEGKHCRGNLSELAGAVCPDGNGDKDTTSYVLPVWDYMHANGDNCVIGGYVYRGANVPGLTGWYLFADNGSKKIRALFWNGAQLCAEPIELTAQLGITDSVNSFSEDSAGELYIMTGAGNVYRIDPS